ncbi:MAG: DUF1659 domain-containing protein [Clostridia bacterium]
MALEVTAMDARLQIQFDLGLNQDGRRILRSKSLSRVKSDVSDEDIYEVAQALIDLQNYPAASIRKIATSEYVNA